LISSKLRVFPVYLTENHRTRLPSAMPAFLGGMTGL
jgi:hypothetical protein